MTLADRTEDVTIEAIREGRRYRLVLEIDG